MTQQPTGPIHAISPTVGTATTCGRKLDPRTLRATYVAEAVSCPACRPQPPAPVDRRTVAAVLALVVLVLVTAGPWLWVNVVLPAVLFVWSVPATVFDLVL